MTPAEQIQHAADFIYSEMVLLGNPPTEIFKAQCFSIAKRLYDLWTKPGGPQRFIPAGEVAQKFRERYEIDAFLENLAGETAQLDAFLENLAGETAQKFRERYDELLQKFAP